MSLNKPESFSEISLESIHLAIALSELGMKSRPADPMGSLGRDTPEPLCEPRVDVQSKGVVLEALDRPHVEGNGIFLEALKIIGAKGDSGRPQDALVFVLGEPEFKAFDDVHAKVFDRVLPCQSQKDGRG